MNNTGRKPHECGCYERDCGCDERPVLVTGASGFVGARIVELFHLNRAANVRAGVRNWSRAARVARCPVEITPCDIMNADQVQRAAEGVRAVVHCAYTDDREVIVEGTRNVLQAALDQGARRFVFLSTAEVYGPSAEGRIVETAVCRPTGGVYGDSKIEAEQLCWDFHCQGLPVTILRPSLVYGPFSKSWTIDVAKRLESGNWGLFENCADGFANLVYVDDLVSAVRLAIERDAAAGEAFNVNGPETGTWNEYFRQFNEALGRPPLPTVSSGRTRLKVGAMGRVGSVARFVVERFREPLMRIYLRGGTLSRIMASVKRAIETTPSPAELDNLYGRRAVYVADKAERLLGYEPAFDLDEGLRLSVLWLRHHGFSEEPAAVAPRRESAAERAAPGKPQASPDEVPVSTAGSKP